MGEAKRRRLLAAKERAAMGPNASPWPLANPRIQRELDAWFVDRDIDASKPGLHDTPQFLQAERQDPKAMNVLARLVEARSYSAEELQQAERKIMVAAQAVAEHIARDGRPGMCVVASNILSRMLDVLGVWNYAAKSNLTIHFPSSISIEPRYFFSVDQRPVVAPHAVVVAPPFTLIDVTVKHQFYDDEAMPGWLPEMAITKEFRPYRVSPAELVAPDIRAMLRRDGYTVEQFLKSDRPAMLEFMRQVPPREVVWNGGRMGYAFIAVGGYQEQLSELDVEGCSLAGKTPIEIFEQDVIPKL